MKRTGITSVALMVVAQTALADATIVTDTPVAQSLVSIVTGEVPEALLQTGADPHHFALRPSQMRALQQADWLIWIGPEFSEWLRGPAEKLGEGVGVLQLADDDATHAWLDPVIAGDWAVRIAEVLGQPAPDDIWARLVAELQPQLDVLLGMGLISGHDAYAEFGARFGLQFVGAISDGHAHDPGPAHLSELRALVQSGAVGCILSDNHEIEPYVDLIVEGSDVPVVEVDLTGQGIAPGPTFYPDLMRGIVADLQACLR